MFAKLLKYAFFLILIKPFVWILLRLRVRDSVNLPEQGPAILAANHNSHLDTMVLMALYPIHKLHHVRPAAAADYWLKNDVVAWFARNIIGIVPVYRQGTDEHPDPLVHCHQALSEGAILIFFPEGSRGEPEVLGRFKYGLAKLVEANTQVPVFPIFLHGVGRVWPKGAAVPIPDVVDAMVGRAVYWTQSREEFMKRFTQNIQQLAAQYGRSNKPKE